jgi:triosephosphate isomerase
LEVGFPDVLCYNNSMANKKIIIGNWKMAPETMKEAKAIFTAIKRTASKLRNVETVVCPPFVYLSELKKISSNKCSIGAQDSFWDSSEEAHTGEISPEMLRGVGVKYVILGHSERRALGETNEIVNKKIKTCLKDKFTVVLCIGELERDENGEYTKFIENEIKESLHGVLKKDIKKLIVAYEPIWAIGKKAKRVATHEDVLETYIFIKKILADMFGKDATMGVSVIYGGSVNQKNTFSFLKQGYMDGLLVGRASLNAVSFNEILKIADSVK